MYKDVCKRILAVAVVICMVVTLVEWPTSVKAAEAPSYHIYQYTGTESAGFASADTASAVFMTGQNAAGGAEIFAGVSFDVHAEEGAELGSAKAVVELYTSPEPGNPESGYFVASSEIYGLTEGTNHISFDAASPKLMRGECFSVLLKLEGEGLSFYTDAYEGIQHTFTKQADGTWQDMGEHGQAVALRAVTYDERMVEPQNADFLTRMARALSAEITEEPGTAGETGAAGNAETTGEIGTIGNTETAGETENSKENIETTEKTENIEEITENTEEISDGTTAGDGITAGDGATADGGVTAEDETLTEDRILEGDMGIYADSVKVELSLVDITLGINEKTALSVQVKSGTLTAPGYEWSVLDGSIAGVEKNGDGESATVTGITPGNTSVTVKVTDGGTEVATLSCKVTVKENVANFTVEPEVIPNHTYDGTAKIPEITVKNGDIILEKDKDYSLAIEGDNTNVSPDGTLVKVKVTGMNTYAGQVIKTFLIEPRTLTDTDVTVEEMLSGDVTDADAVASKIKVAGANGATLQKDTDYTLTLEDTPAAPGKHSAVITGIGNYTGEIKKDYIVKNEAANLIIEFSESSYIYTAREIHPEIKVYEKAGEGKGEELGAENYTVSYTDCTNVGKGTVTVTMKGTNNYYGTVKANFEIVPKDIANADNTLIPVNIPETLPVAARPTAGEAIPVFEMSQNGIVLKKDTDYELAVAKYYPEGADANTATSGELTIRGKGNYTGSVTMPYQIGTDIQNAITSIIVNNGANAVYTGTEITPTVTVEPASLVKGRDYEVSYKNNINAGTAEIYVRGIGAYGGTYISVGGGNCSATFEIKPFDVSGLTYTYNNEVTYSPKTEEMIPSVVVAFNGTQLKEGVDYTLTPPAGTELEVGKTPALTITGNGGNFTGTHTLAYNVIPCPLKNAPGSDRPIVLSMIRDHQYTGSPVDPQIKLEYVDAEGKAYPLTEGKDYAVGAYDKVSCGEKSITITGKGNYGGGLVEYINIIGVHIKAPTLTVKNGIDDPGYKGGYKAFKKYQDGAAITLDITLTYEGETLQEGKDYTLSYTNNRAMSSLGKPAKVCIKGEGNYVGEMEIPFLIYKELGDCTISGVKNQTYTGEEITFPGLTVKDGLLDGTLVPDVDYQVVYKDNLNVTNAPDTAEVTVKAMDSLPTQNGCYTGSQAKTFTIGKKDLGTIDNLTYEEIVKTYAGQDVKLTADDIKLSYPLPSGIGMKKLEETTDYVIEDDSYNGNKGVTEKGKPASVLISGQGNFSGAAEIEFSIVGKSIADVTAELTPGEYKYTGAGICPEPVLTDGGQVLKKGTDYQLSWENNINAGEAAVIVTGIGNYSGKKTIPFKILQLNLKDTADGTASVSGVAASYTFTGTEIEPEPVVEFTRKGMADADTLVKGKDYIVTYTGNRNVGTATMTIKGIGNYIGTVEQTFAITKKSIADPDVKVAEIPPQAWEGMDVCPPVTVTCGDYTLKEGEDYTLSYDDNFSLGTATVTVTGNGNYDGTRTEKFSIALSIESSDITVTCDAAGKTYTYTGKEIEPEVTVMNTVTGQKLVKGTNYEVVYSNNTNVGTASIVVRGKGTYTGEKAPIEFKIVAKNIGDTDVTAKLAAETATYTGTAIEPEATVKYNDITLIPEKDYMIRYTDNTNAGIASAVITANGGNYIGTKTITFTIEPKSIGSGNAFATGFGMEKLEDQGYTGAEICPMPSIYRKNADGSKTALVYGDDADYTLAWKNNIQIGTASVIISGNGNYKGSVTQTFVIKGGLDGAVITLAGVTDGTIRYEDGTPKMSNGAIKSYIVEPVPTVTLKGKTLVKGKDYTVSYENNDFVGTAKAVITGTGSYGGTLSETFTILGDMEKAEIAPIERQTYTGQVIEPNPAVTYYGRVIRDGVDYIRSYTNNIDIGTATLTIAGDGNFTGIQNAEFTIDPADGKFVVSEIPAQKYCGKQIIPEVTVSFAEKILTKDTDYTVSAGTNLNAGQGTVTITGKGSYADIDPVTKTFTINPLSVNELVLNDPENDDPVFTGIAPKEYTGTAVIPKISLTYEEGGKVIYKLNSNDYTITCKEGYSNTEVGEAAVVIEGKGNNVYDTRTEYFTITQKDINNAPVSITVSGSSSYTYTGTQICPNVVVKNGTSTLTKDVDYFVDYGENIAVGNGTITVQGNDNYMGTKTVSFKIGRLGMTSASIKIAPIPEQEYTGKAICPPVTVTHTDGDGAEHVLVENVDYTLTYQGNTAAGTKARAVLTGKGNFMGSRTETFTITKHDIGAADVTMEAIPNQAYTGRPLTPSVTLKYGNDTLVRGKDYNLAYVNNTELGTATVTILGIGNFAGERTAEFKIVASDISAAEIEILEDTPWIYTGAEIKPEKVTVKIGETELTPGQEYTLDYRNNINAGTAVLIVNGAGEYGGSKEVTFQIERKDITEKEVVLDGFKDSVAYTGEEVKQNVTLTYGELILEENRDYSVQYSGNTAIGQAKMLITGTGNYAGTLEKTFEISEKQIFDENLIVKDISSTYTYTGEAITPKPTLNIGDVLLTEGTDYTLTYENNIDAGVAKMTIEGIGNYSGSREETFNILRKSIQLGTFSGIDTQLYTGKEIKPDVLVSDNNKGLTMGQDYSLIYENNRNAGTATAIVAGIKNYTATKTLRFDIRPGNVKGLAVTGLSDTAISLGWNAGGVVTGYEVYRAGADGKYQKIARVHGTAYTDKQLEAGVEYTYKVRAYLVNQNETYYSAFSPVVNGKL